MEYAVIRTGGKQYKVSKDTVLDVERLSFKAGEAFTIDDVLLHVVDSGLRIGKPKVSGVAVKATVLEHLKGDKLRIAKFKAKAKYRRATGHRQYLTKIKINDITVGKK
ncbi:MAG: 50S ribosomal protein L21 [Candidatus Levybacteria bacterium]|nr:50S ribosomal protein L21 [Candidatus Levybacteria bacterium]